MSERSDRTLLKTRLMGAGPLGYRARRFGAGLSALLFLPIAIGLLVLGWPDPRLTSLAIAGLAVSAVVGFLFTARAVFSRRGSSLALSFSVTAVVLGAPTWAVTFCILGGNDVRDALGIALVGTIFLGVPMVVLGFLLATLWLWLMRWSDCAALTIDD